MEGSKRFVALHQNVLSALRLYRRIFPEPSAGIGLTILCFGDSSLGERIAEALAHQGNRNDAFIDDGMPAHKIFRRELRSTLLTIAQ